MNFELSEEQLLIQGMVKEFAASDVAPIAAEIDRDHRFPEQQRRLPELLDLALDPGTTPRARNPLPRRRPTPAPHDVTPEEPHPKNLAGLAQTL